VSASELWAVGVVRVGLCSVLTTAPHDTSDVHNDQGPLRVLIADDHRLMREGTAALLASDERVEVVGLAADGGEAIALAERRRPDVALLDLNMPGVGGIEACAAIRRRSPQTEVMILTVSEQEPDLYASLRVGAAGYLLKDIAPAELIEAVLAAGRGEPRIPASMAGRLLQDLAGAREADPDPLGSLSDREREVLALLAEGLRNREIAERLVISEATVKTHVRHVLEKLRFRNRAEAAAFAARHLG
jgi:DNA-binding NarL/FixJ family response regulator